MIPADYIPVDQDDLFRCLADPLWRICSGQLYRIMVKSASGDESIIPFKPNRAQRRLIARLWHRNIILKARQMGFTTVIAILWLDHALFNANQRCGIIAQDKPTAKQIFRDKVKLAYDNLPEFLRARMPLSEDSASELLFAHNNSSIAVSTSMRGGTIHRLLVSEFGKIGAKYPAKAEEVVTGSLPAVPVDGIVVIESTAEGQAGEFFEMTKRAREVDERGVTLSPRDYRFHFAAWWQEPSYRMSHLGGAVMTKQDIEYFDGLEAIIGVKLDREQRNWYVATRDSEFSGDPQKMWQEYPSIPDEAFKVSLEGTYYLRQLSAARKAGRITQVPHLDGVPVHTFWDIGGSDGTAVWLMQQQGLIYRFIGFLEGWDEPYSYYIKELQKLEYVWGTHFLPHDAGHKRQQGTEMASAEDSLRKLSLGGEWVVLDRIDDVMHGINMTRDVFSQCVFDETHCAAGLAHLGMYRKEWNRRLGKWKDTPLHDIHSEAADALRQFAQCHGRLAAAANRPAVTASRKRREERRARRPSSVI